MRKKISEINTMVTILGCVFFSICGYSQDLPKGKNGEIQYEKIILKDSIDSKKLHAVGLQWIANTYKSANDVIQMNDVESGKIIVKGSVPVVLNYGMIGKIEGSVVNHTIELAFKQGRTRILVYNLYHDGLGKTHSGGSIGSEKPACGTMNMSVKVWNEDSDE